MTESQKVLKRRKYMREYMRRRALNNPTRKFPPKPRMNPALYKGDPQNDFAKNMIQFKSGIYKIEFD